MEPARDGVLLRVFIGDADRRGGHSLYRTIVTVAHKAGLAGATALHGPLSYGPSRHVNFEFNVDAPGNLPIVIEIIDRPDKIEAFLPQLDSLMEFWPRNTRNAADGPRWPADFGRIRVQPRW